MDQIRFISSSLLLGVGLSMDAFSVSVANGLGEPHMSGRKKGAVAGTFAFFQFLMPMIGWGCVRTAAQHFQSFRRLIPWIALLLLGYIGGKMIWEGVKGCPEETAGVGAKALFLQGIATSIDALSVGFTIADYTLTGALVCCLLIAAVTFLICGCGLRLGRSAGEKLEGRASLLGGVILIAIGIEIFVGNW